MRFRQDKRKHEETTAHEAESVWGNEENKTL